MKRVFDSKTGLMRYPKKVSLSKAKAEAWKWFSRFVRLRGSKDGYNTCVTCGRKYPVSGQGCIQAGHFVPGRKNSVLYDERGCWPQCYMCNVVGKGSWVEYETFITKKYGPDVCEELKMAKHKTLSMSALEHLETADRFKAKVNGLGGWPGEA